MTERTYSVYTEHVLHDIKSQVRGFFYHTKPKKCRAQYCTSIANWVFTRKWYIDRERVDTFLQFNFPDLLSNEYFEYNILVACMVKHAQLIIDKVLVHRKFKSGIHCSYQLLTYHTTPYALRSDITNVDEMDLPGVMDKLNVLTDLDNNNDNSTGDISNNNTSVIESERGVDDNTKGNISNNNLFVINSEQGDELIGEHDNNKDDNRCYDDSTTGDIAETNASVIDSEREDDFNGEDGEIEEDNRCDDDNSTGDIAVFNFPDLEMGLDEVAQLA